jgi:hypothetical protein
VVADEVRNLAQRSAQAAKDRASLIEESIVNSEEGNAKVELVAQSISAITDSVGKVIPVVDLRLKFGFPSQAYDERTCIIVVDVVLRAGRVMMGVVVDAVSEVLTIAANEIEATPDFGEHVNTEFMQGVAKIKGRVKFLLDLDRIFGGVASLL